MLKNHQNISKLNDMQPIRPRNYGIDLLRVVATFMVVLLHVFSQGGVLKASGDFTIKGETMWFIQIACFCAVNVFALISGYVGLGAKQKISNLLTLWIQVVLYCAASVAIINLFELDDFSIKKLLEAFFPVSSSQNWYFSAYFVLFFFMPIFNEIIMQTEKKILKRGWIAAVVLFMLLETVKSVEVFGVENGYSVLWLTLMYLTGAYIKKYDPLKHLSSMKCILGFLGCVLLTFLSRLGIELVTWRLTGVPSHGTKFITYTSPLMVLQAIFFLELFSKMRIPKSIAIVASRLAPMTFGVFIIHTTTAVYRYVLRDAFLFVKDFSLIGALGFSILATIGICLLCGMIDWIRIYLFWCIKINKLIDYVDGAMERLLNRL